MATNIIRLSTVEAATLSNFPIPLIENSTEDIVFHLGTGLTSSGTFTSPNGVDISITAPEGTFTGTLGDIISRNSATVYANAAPASLVFEFLNNFEVDINAFAIRNDTTLEGPLVFTLEGSNDDVTYTEIRKVVTDAADWTNVKDHYFYCDNRKGFFKYIKLRQTLTTTTPEISEIRFYGRLRNLVSGNAGSKVPGDTFSSLLDVDVTNIYDNRIIVYNGSVWETRPNVPWRISNQVLTGDLDITDAYIPTFYVLSPNGANRIVTLPNPSPVVDDAIKIKSMDGSFDITVREDPADVTPIVLNNAGKLQYEFIWDGTEWIVTG